MARAGLTTQRVTQAAADLADEVGFDKLTISTLARRFGVADPSIYSHVRSLKDLRNRVAALAAVELADSIAPAVAGRAGKDALVAFANAYRDFARAHPGRYAAFQIQLDDASADTSSGHRRVIDMTNAVFRAYGMLEPDLTDAVRLVRSTFHGFVSLEAIGGFANPRAPQRSWERSIDALHSMLLNWVPDSADETPEPVGTGQG